MQLIADRFAVDDTGVATDLATGAPVVLIVEPAGAVPQQLQWSERCELLHMVRHPAIAPLVDFGLVGATSRFEAWASGAEWRGSIDAARAVRDAARRFLRAMKVTAGRDDAGRMGTSRSGVGIWVPDAGSGYPTPAVEESDPPLPLVEHGVRAIDRPAVAALSHAFRIAAGARPHIASVWGPPDSGRRTAIAALARAARLQGLVPIAAHLADSRCAPLVVGRSLVVIAADAARPWPIFLRVSLRTAVPHVLVIVGDSECRGVAGVPLRAVAADALAESVRPRVAGGPLEGAVQRAAESARGLPGRFVRRLWRRPAEAVIRRRVPAGVPLAAEHPSSYGLNGAVVPTIARDSGAGASAWPAPGELGALRRKLESALVLFSAGRHEPGLRVLRQAIAALARRGAWIDAAGGGVHLGAALLQRGRPIDAQKAIDEATECAARSGDAGLLADLAVLSGSTWIDRVRLDEAEAVLATAVAAARATGDAARVAAAGVAMARCLFWRGRFAEAAAALEGCPPALPRELDVRRAALAARIAAAMADISGAMAHAAAAASVASTAGARPLEAGAFYARAFVHLAAGDFDAADREIVQSIAAAHAAHDPLRALRARLLRVEVERRRGRTVTAAALVARLARAAASAPPLVRARWQLASALCARGTDADACAIVERQATTTGLGGLSAYALPAASPAPALGDDPFLHHVLSILHVCQTADDDSVVLKDVCVRVRRHLHAAAVSFVAVRDGRSQVIASDGSRIDGDIAARAVAAAITIAPRQRENGIEAAAPVLYGGASIAALCAQWTIGSTYDTSRAASVLTMTAAAAAPVVAMAVQTRDAAPPSGDAELLGVSAAMIDLRRSVASAASAPFAVLIEGESGSGKELVARAIHRGSVRRHKPFCTLNCAALPEDLVEAELFGHARGSFTGAVVDRVGVFEDAHGGTLFLDEIGELSARAQAKMLRVIQEGELRRVGETASRRIDVRIVAATNRDLRQEVDAGRFRLDLLYRIDVIHIAVPRLRDRVDDVGVLAEHFWRDATARVGSRATLGAATLAALAAHEWPGNVRELQNVLAALAARCPKRGVVPPTALPALFLRRPAAPASRLDEARRSFEERFVRAALVRTGGHRARAAEELGVTRQGLTKLMSRLGISP